MGDISICMKHERRVEAVNVGARYRLPFDSSACRVTILANALEHPSCPPERKTKSHRGDSLSDAKERKTTPVSIANMYRLSTNNFAHCPREERVAKTMRIIVLYSLGSTALFFLPTRDSTRLSFARFVTRCG